MPSLTVLGGANGVGKTTWYRSGIEKGYISKELPFINVDMIAKNELGGYTLENIAKAEQIARERMTTLIKDGKDFMIESNLCKSSDYDWIQLMKNKGYDTKLFFLNTGDVNINISRVQQRVSQGGHHVPIPIIEQRFAMSSLYIKSKVIEFSEAVLIDVSKGLGILMATLKDGKITSEHLIPEKWVIETLYIARKLQERLEKENNAQLKSPRKGLGL